jgi:hypothetical protein
VFDDNPSLDGLLPSGANLGKRRSFLESMRPTSGTAVLTFIAHGTTPFIATFMLIHLTAPATATLGGSSLASQLMVRGDDKSSLNSCTRTHRFGSFSVGNITRLHSEKNSL